jgi:hypothetical protein
MHTQLRGKKVISVIRDPRDTIVSYYHHKKSRDGEYNGSLDDFLRDEGVGFVRLLAFLNAQMSVSQNDEAAVLQVTYEEMHEDTQKVLQEVLYFLGIEEDETLVQEAIDYSHFDAVKNRERTGELENGRFGKGFDGTENSYKARKGKVGSYKEEMNQEQIVWCNTLMEAMLPKELQFYLESY